MSFLTFVIRLKSCGFPVYLLPRTVPAPCFAGKLAKEWHHVPAGIPVGVAMGDLQCSVCAAMPEPGDAGACVVVRVAALGLCVCVSCL